MSSYNVANIYGNLLITNDFKYFYLIRKLFQFYEHVSYFLKFRYLSLHETLIHPTGLSAFRNLISMAYWQK